RGLARHLAGLSAAGARGPARRRGGRRAAPEGGRGLRRAPPRAENADGGGPEAGRLATKQITKARREEITKSQSHKRTVASPGSIKTSCRRRSRRRPRSSSARPGGPPCSALRSPANQNGDTNGGRAGTTGDYACCDGDGRLRTVY